MLLRIDDYLETLPENVLSGEDVQLSEKSLKNIFKFAEHIQAVLPSGLNCGGSDVSDFNCGARPFSGRSYGCR